MKSLLLATLALVAVSRAAELTALNDQAQAAHLKRALGDASALYKQILTAEAPVAPTAEQRALVLRFAPRLQNVPNEFFPLKDIVALLHPEKPVIAYHLFWEDDLGFPSDNDPCDHEIVWVEYAPATLKVVRVWTYFHGRVLTTDAATEEANAHGGRPWIAVEWGFHGSVPWKGRETDPATDAKLKDHWTTARNGKKMPRDPLARGWPEEYAASYEAFTTFSVLNDPVPMLKSRDLVYITRWPNATLNRYCLRYNFAWKLEWPWLVK
jgi:hypothetical protein